MGIVEVLLATGLGGVIYSIFAGQGLVIVGITGPTWVFLKFAYKLNDSLDLKFIPFMCWVSIWTGVFLILLGVFRSCRLVTWVTPYAEQSFGFLIGIIFIYDGIKELVEEFQSSGVVVGGWALIYFLTAFLIMYLMEKARDSTGFLNKITREAVSAYAVPIGMFLASGLSVLVRDNTSSSTMKDVPRVEVPSKFRPTDNCLEFWTFGFRSLY